MTINNNGGAGNPQVLSFSQTFTYDKVNRLLSAADSGGWSRNFGYDAYGNMWVSGSAGIAAAGNTPGLASAFNSANQTGGSYDQAGNELLVNGNSAAYDAENRMTTFVGPASLGGLNEMLTYDGRANA